MDFFISNAYAEAGAAAGSNMLELLFLPAMLVFMFFFLIRPQMKRAKEHKNMVAALSKGNEVVTNGGVLGKITEVGEDFLTVQVADNVELKVQKSAIANVLPKGTIKNA